jgi:hypothetical protein
MKNPIKNIVTIGDGIAAWCLHDVLCKNKSLKITNISENNFFKPCSFNSTSINCLRGTEAGVSELGDKIIKSHKLFEEFYEQERPDGVYKGVEYQLWRDKDNEKWLRRYKNFSSSLENPFLQKLITAKFNYVENEAYFIHPEKLKAWFLKRQNNITYKNAFVSKIIKQDSGYDLFSGDQHLGHFDKVILCTNQATHYLAMGISKKFDYFLAHSKPVAGTYLETDLSNLDVSIDKNFNLAVGKHHFIYRKDSKRLQIGSTLDNKSEVALPNIKDVELIYRSLNKVLNFDLPEIEKFNFKTGIRHKGYERNPFWGKISEDEEIFSICALYKNAFTFAFMAAKELETQI